MDLILILTCMLFWVPEVALNFRHYSTHCCIKWRKSHFISVSRVDRLSSLWKYQEVFPYLVEFFQIVRDLNIDALRVNVVSLEEQLNRIDVWNWLDLRLRLFLLSLIKLFHLFSWFLLCGRLLYLFLFFLFYFSGWTIVIVILEVLENLTLSSRLFSRFNWLGWL